MLNGDMMELLSTLRPHRMRTYHWDKPIGAFLWPMNSLQQVPGERELDYDQLEAYFIESGDYYWIARIYKSYTGNLDAYIKWKGENRVTRYILEFDPADVNVGANYDGWPQPRDFYLARAAIRTTESWSLGEYNAIPEMAIQAAIQAAPAAIGDDAEPTIEEGGTVAEMPIQAAIQAAPAAIGDDAEPTIEEGGTVVLCMLCYFFILAPARPPL